MNKLNFLKTSKQQVRDYLRLSRNYRQHEFNDMLLAPGAKKPFKHSWNLMVHMHDLRVWTLAYSPSRYNNLKRMQELHRLNTEMWYQVGESLYKRFFVFVVLWFLVNRVFKNQLLNYGAKDT